MLSCFYDKVPIAAGMQIADVGIAVFVWKKFIILKFLLLKVSLSVMFCKKQLCWAKSSFGVREHKICRKLYLNGFVHNVK